MGNQHDLEHGLFLKFTLEDIVNDPSEENCLQLFGELLVCMSEGVAVPTPMENVTYIVLDTNPNTELGDVFPEDMKRKNTVAILSDENGKLWLPIFTAEEEMKELSESHEVKDILIREIFEQALADKNIEGILINPLTDSYALHREMVEFVLAHSEGELGEAS